MTRRLSNLRLNGGAAVLLLIAKMGEEVSKLTSQIRVLLITGLLMMGCVRRGYFQNPASTLANSSVNEKQSSQINQAQIDWRFEARQERPEEKAVR